MESRVNKSMKNTVFGMLGVLCNLLVAFASRTIFIRLLGAEYNGVNSLFTNILTVLSLSELGFSVSIAYALYKPLKEMNEEAISRLMNYFAKVYRVIALVVAIAGSCCIPFLQYLIAEDMSTLPFSLGQLRTFFAIYLLNTVCSYLLAYKRTIITADQNSYIVSNIDNLCNIGMNVLQIVLLLIYKNYYVFLIAMVAKTLINNIILQIIADKKYPFMKKYKHARIHKDEKTELFKNVQAMFLHRVGGVVVSSSITIVISAMVSILDSGIYGNYLVIITGVNAFLSILFNALTASVGNLCVSEGREYQYVIFRRIQYLSNFCAFFVLVCYMCLFNDFMQIWLGEDMMFSFAIVLMIAFREMLTYLRKTLLLFRDATGLFRKDWLKPILESVLGIALAIGFSYIWGTFGVFLGYTLATVCIAVPVEIYIIFRHGLCRNGTRDILEMVGTVVLGAAVTALVYWICSYIPSGIGWFILEAMFCCVFSMLVYVVVTCRTQEFRYYKNFVIELCKKIVGKLKSTVKRDKGV